MAIISRTTIRSVAIVSPPGGYTVDYLVVAGGGGGAGYPTPSSSGTGGSGIVIVSYPGAQRGTGGTVTYSGGNTIHTFTESGTYTA
jgi:hypothetical protein